MSLQQSLRLCAVLEFIVLALKSESRCFTYRLVSWPEKAVY
jgi:hypothetical protein